MTTQISFYYEDPMSWHTPEGIWTAWEDYSFGPEYDLADNISKFRLREKPPFVPGWFRRQASSYQIFLEYCNTREPLTFAGQWKRVEEGDMDDLLGFNVD